MSDRTRNWVFLFYPTEVCQKKEGYEYYTVEQFINYLNNIICVSGFYSPLHHGYGSEEEGDERKDHYHFCITFDGVKSKRQVIDLLSDFDQVSFPVACNSVPGSAQYFVHLNNPEKEQFKGGLKNIGTFGVFDLDRLLVPTSSQIDIWLSDMRMFIDDNDIYEYCDFVQICDIQFFDSYGYVLKHGYAYYFKLYIDSRRNALKESLRS